MNNEPKGPGRPPLEDSKDDRIVIRTQGWRVGGVRRAAKLAKKTFAQFVEDALDLACEAWGVKMPPDTKKNTPKP